MFLWSLLKKFSKDFEKRQIIRDVIDKLKLDQKQEQIYIECLEILDDENLDLFYRKLVALVDIIEERDALNTGKKQTDIIQSIREKESKEEPVENFNILFDNI